MKIFFFIPSLEKGGIERSLSRISRKLIDLGWDVTLLTNELSIEGKSYFEASIKIIRVETPFENKKSLFFQLLNNILLFIKFRRIINSKKPKLVLAAKNFPLAVFLKKFSKHNFKLILREAVDPHVAASIQRNYIFERIILFIKRIIYPKSDRIIAISNGVKISLVDKLSIDSKMVNVIYNPAADEKIIDLSQEFTDDYSFKNYTIVNIGRLTKQKDHLTILKAFKLVIKKTKCNLLIIGEGSEKENIENYIRNNDLENYVKLLGYKSNPWKYLSKSNLFVLSSIWEGFGNVIVESMLLGIPVISTRCKSGPAEILENGKYGKLYDIYDYTKLSELILSEISSKELRNNSDIAKKRSEDFSIDKITESYIKSFDELLT
tara:strand:- start:3105 stop:4238 length:1134 start_codon:yes stop_codon:yes gene_type:complete